MPAHDWTRVEAGIFAHFHTYWLTEIGRALNRRVLPSPYYALAEQVAGGFGPDVLTLDRSSGNSGDRNGSSRGDSGTILLKTPPQVSRVAKLPSPPKQPASKRLQIRHVSGHRVVAVIEIVSPGNKSSESAVRSLVEKGKELLIAGVHRLLIDLFPPTTHVPDGIHEAIWAGLGCETESNPVRASAVSYSAGEEIQAFIEPFEAGESIPGVPLFLEVGEYVHLDLEDSYRAAFEDVPTEWRDRLENG